MTCKRTAVTGAGGLIGRATVTVLQGTGADVRGLVGPKEPDPLQPPDGPGSWAWGDITDPVAAAGLLEGCASVIHLAGPPSVARSFASPGTFLAAHTAGAATILHAAAASGTVRRVVLVSSAEVYGVPQTPLVSEDAPIDPLSPYAVAKHAAEEVAAVLARSFDLEVVIVRPFAVYGSSSPPWSLVGGAVTQAMQSGDEPVAMNDLARVRDLVFVDDVADLLVRAAHLPLDSARGACICINAATGRGTTVLELARAALRAAGRDAPIIERPPRPQPTMHDIVDGARPAWSDPVRLVGDPAKAIRLLGWTPATNVETGLAAVVAHRRQQQ